MCSSIAAVAGRRLAAADQAGARPGQRDRRQDSRRRPGDRDLRRVGARQQLDAGQCRRRLRRAQGLERCAARARTCARCFRRFNREFAAISEARIVVLPPPPIQGIGNAGGFAMQLQLRDGSFDLAKLQAVTNTVVKDAQTQSSLQRVTSSFRSTVPQMKIDVDRAKAETLQVAIDDVFSTLAAYLGSSYVDQFNKFGRTFQVYVQADSQFRLRPRGHRASSGAQQAGQHDPARHHGPDHPDGRAVAAQPLQPLPVLDDPGAAGRRASAPARRWR